MEKTVATLSPQEFEKLVERAVDKRMSVWLTQFLDAMGTMDEEIVGIEHSYTPIIARGHFQVILQSDSSCLSIRFSYNEVHASPKI